MKNNKGFSLVELIVVIAIMAILAAVAVAGFSVYIPKAQQANDKQMIDDIEYVLNLHAQSTPDDVTAGYIILSPTANAQASSDFAIKVLEATYGADWETELKLAYEDWGYEGSIIGLKNAQAVKNSSYYQSADKLMGQVEEITGAAWNIFTGENGEASKDEMLGMFDAELLSNVINKYGYSSIEEVPDDALPNLLVLAVATDVADANQTDRELTGASSIVSNFALYNGYASTQAGKDSGFADAYDKFVKEINEANDVDAVAAAYRKLKAETEGNSGWDTYKNTQSDSDSEAFASMMSGMAGAAFTHGEGIKEGLTQNDFFTAGLGSELFANYMDSVDAMAGMSEEHIQEIMGACDNGKVVIYFTVNQEKLDISNTLPTE